MKINFAEISKLQLESIPHYLQANRGDLSLSELEKLILNNHFYNCQLWKLEDMARDPNASDGIIASTKRKIDSLNQKRNDAIEEVNVYLHKNTKINPQAPLCTETPGSTLDRLSINELKIYHTQIILNDQSTSPQLQKKCEHRREVLDKQKEDLISALSYLWDNILAGGIQFKLYRQLKMYNDSQLNPYLK